MSGQLAGSYAAMESQMSESLRSSDPGSYTYTYNSPSFINYPSYAGGFTIGGDQLGRDRMHTSIKAVRVKAGFLGQVIASNVEATILWESTPKKTLTKAEAAARKAQLRAAQRSFE